MGNCVLPETTLVELRCATVAYTPGNYPNPHREQPGARVVLSTFLWNLLRKVMNSKTCSCSQGSQRSTETLWMKEEGEPFSLYSFNNRLILSVIFHYELALALESSPHNGRGCSGHQSSQSFKFPLQKPGTECSFIKTNPSSLLRVKESATLARMLPPQQLFTAIWERNSQKSPAQRWRIGGIKTNICSNRL